MHACIDCQARAEASGPAETAGRTPAAARAAAATTVARRALAIAPGGLSAWLLRGARGDGDGDEAGEQEWNGEGGRWDARATLRTKGEGSERDETRRARVSEGARRGEGRRGESSRRGGRGEKCKWMDVDGAWTCFSSTSQPLNNIYYTNNTNIYISVIKCSMSRRLLFG